MSDKLPYNAGKWQGDEDLNGLPEQFIDDILFLIGNVETVLSTNVLEESDHPLFYSALLNVLVSTRSLMQKRYFVTKTPSEYKKLFKRVKDCRDCLNHSGDNKVADNKTVFKLVWMPDDTANDIALYIGSETYWVKKDILKTYSILKAYYEQKLPSDIGFVERCISFNLASRNNQQ